MKQKQNQLDQDFPKKQKKQKYNPKQDPLRKNKKAYLMNPYKEYSQ